MTLQYVPNPIPNPPPQSHLMNIKRQHRSRRIKPIPCKHIQSHPYPNIPIVNVFVPSTWNDPPVMQQKGIVDDVQCCRYPAVDSPRAEEVGTALDNVRTEICVTEEPETYLSVLTLVNERDRGREGKTGCGKMGWGYLND
jgi:hypothetical protein